MGLRLERERKDEMVVKRVKTTQFELEFFFFKNKVKESVVFEIGRERERVKEVKQ